MPLEYARTRDPAHLKAAYLEWAELDAARRQLLAHIEHHAGLLEQWRDTVREIEDGTSTMLNRALAPILDADHKNPGLQALYLRGTDVLGRSRNCLGTAWAGARRPAKYLTSIPSPCEGPHGVVTDII